MNLIKEITVFIEPNCIACERVLNVLKILERYALVEQLIIVNSIDDPEHCRLMGVVIFPATFINGKLMFYGEFTFEDVIKSAQKEIN